MSSGGTRRTRRGDDCNIHGWRIWVALLETDYELAYSIEPCVLSWVFGHEVMPLTFGVLQSLVLKVVLPV